MIRMATSLESLRLMQLLEAQAKAALLHGSLDLSFPRGFVAWITENNLN